MGHDDHDISEAFSRYDQDRNHILDREEQEKMKRELEEKRVWNSFPLVFFLLYVVLFYYNVSIILFYQNALSAELHNLTHGNNAEDNKKMNPCSINQEQFEM